MLSILTQDLAVSSEYAKFNAFRYIGLREPPIAELALIFLAAYSQGLPTVNPLQIATITTSLAPLAARSLAKIADVFSLDGNATDNTTSANETAANEAGNVSKSTDTDGNSTLEGGNSRFSQLYQSLTGKLKSLLQQLPQLDGSDSSLQVTIQSDGKLNLQSDDPTVDLKSVEDWLNQDSEISELAAATLRAKQDAEWHSGLSNLLPSTELNLRIQLGSAKTA